ncbi:MAG TPA: neutral/alkaline non-lysosomal ceramidase N-terminal domain-containing protein [Cellulomonas sp.]
MRVGNARFDITPAGRTYLGGYRAESRLEPARGVHDRIWGNALLFDDGATQAFLVSLDLVEIEETMADDVKTLLAGQFGIDRDLVLVAATHDHSSTAVYHRDWWTRKFDQVAYDALLEQIADAFTTCRDGLRPASAVYGRDTVLGHYGNRNHPGEPADNQVTVVTFLDDEGRPFCGIVGWAVHSTVLPAANDQLTGDLAGAVRDRLAEAFGFHPLMMVGAAGDCSNRHQRQGRDFAELERVSTALAGRIAAIPLDRHVELGPVRCQTLFHTVHHDGFHLDAKGWVVDLGQLRLFVFPGELGSAFGPRLRANHPGLALVCGYTNGYYAYWMPAEEYGLSFETTSSRIPRGEPERLVAKLVLAASLLDG